MKNFFRKILKWLGYSLAILIILTATMVSIGSLMTPYLNGHRADFEKWASDLLKMPVTIRNVEISWYFYKPVLDFEEVAILDKDTHQKLIQLEELKIHLSFLRSLLQKQVVPDYIRIAGVHLTVQQKEQDQFNISGLGDIQFPDRTSPIANQNDLVLLILSQPYLILDNIEIKYIPKQGSTRIIRLNEFVLENSNQKHVITANAILKQKIPLNVTAGLTWYGKEIDPAKISANVYLYLESISLEQWLRNKNYHQIQIKNGIGSIKLWADWRENQWQKIQTQFEFFDLDLYSQKTEKSEFFNRISGDIGWETKGDKIIIAGEDILIDLPDHYWPTNSFLLSFTKKKKDPIELLNSAAKQELDSLQMDSFRTNYLDLDDLKDFILNLGILNDTDSQKWATLNPEGELKNINVQISNPNWLNNRFFADLSYVSWSPLDHYPGIHNLSGELNWDGKRGYFNIQSDELAFMMPALFENRMVIDELSGQLHLEKDSNDHWQISGKNIQTKSHDHAATIDLNLQSSGNDDALIDLEAEYSLANGSKIINYLPLRIFSPDLSAWLKNAFHGGKIISGKAVVSGSLKAFPFEKGGGKLSIGGEVQDLNLNYAEGWPLLRHLNGHLLFTPHTMTADVVSGTILNIPIQHFHASIPNLSEPHSELAMSGHINSDLAEGQRFIEQSPLQKTLGKSLKDLKMKGAMQLDLGLLVPLDHIPDISVKGHLDMMNGQMSLPKWNLELSQLTGKIRFTDKEIEATQVRGSLFNENVEINMLTEHPDKGPSYIRPTIKGRMDIQTLSNWLKIPLSRYLQGKTNYFAELRLVSSESSKPNQLMVNSDLMGVQVDLPFAYGKKADSTRNFNLLMNFQQKAPLELKVFYGDLFSAALTLQSDKNDHLQVYSGEVRLGKNKDASLQKQPGIMLTGTVDELNYDELIKAFPELGMKQDSAASTASLDLRSADININQLTVFSQTLNKAHVRLSKKNKNWLLQLESPEMDGQLTLPSDHQPIQAHFKYLYLSAGNKNSGSTIDPRTIPSISFVGEDVRYQSIQFGKMYLDAEHVAGGLAIKRWNLNSPLFSVTSSGLWQAETSGSQSLLHGTLTSKNVSAFLKQWGVQSSNLIGSGGKADFDLSWDDAPYAITLANVTGSLSLNLTAGRIINLGESTDAKLGIGRLLNILSLQTIPHLLSLDFGGLFAQGYSFDRIRGDITLRGGSAYIKNFVSDSSVARVEISGRMGLVAKDYDLLMSVTPYVTGSIPVVAALAVNPIAGVAALAVEKVARGAVSKVSIHRYAITGSWNKPVWKQI